MWSFHGPQLEAPERAGICPPGPKAGQEGPRSGTHGWKSGTSECDQRDGDDHDQLETLASNKDHVILSYETDEDEENN